MTRVIKKYYFLFISIVCISFWALVQNIGLPEYSSESNFIRNDANRELSDQLNKLEGELTSQKLQSSILLRNIKDKFTKGHLQPPISQSRNSNNKPNSNDVRGNLNNVNELKEWEKIHEHMDGNAILPGEVKNGIEYAQAGRDTNNNENAGDQVDLKKTVALGSPPNYDESVIAVLVFVCNRPTINRCLDSLLKHRPSSTKFPVIVSQDCGSHPATTDVLSTYADRITQIKQPDLSEITVPPKEEKLKGYYKISRHYGWALNHTFTQMNYTNVLVVEDDLEVAPDFFEYFSATLPILRSDPSLWCVSAWNDNGKSKRINESAVELLHRTDFFPGLGWMLTKDLWTELMVKWPKSYWDDWMREPGQRRDRACIRPEISRTSTFGKNGVSHGTYYQNHLRFIKLNQEFVPFTSIDLSYLSKDKYDVEFVRRVYSSQIVQSVKELQSIIQKGVPSNVEYRLTYRTREGFTLLAKKLEIMEDLRAGVPRTAYRGVVSFMFMGQRVYLAPGANWVGY